AGLVMYGLLTLLQDQRRFVSEREMESLYAIITHIELLVEEVDNLNTIPGWLNVVTAGLVRSSALKSFNAILSLSLSLYIYIYIYMCVC
ncbi:hypothetical protein KIPB_015785, partial [Kipferlia bialata]